MSDITDIDRRKLLGSVAAAGGAMPLLAACADDSDGDGSDGSADRNNTETGQGSGSGGDDNGSDGQGAGFTMKVSEVPVGRGTIVKGERIVVTQPQQGEFKAFSAICTHNKCVVSEVTEEAIICHCHQSHYNLSSGEVLSGPAPRPLPEKKVQQDDDTLRIS